MKKRVLRLEEQEIKLNWLILRESFYLKNTIGGRVYKSVKPARRWLHTLWCSNNSDNPKYEIRIEWYPISTSGAHLELELKCNRFKKFYVDSNCRDVLRMRFFAEHCRSYTQYFEILENQIPLFFKTAMVYILKDRMRG